MDTFEDLHHDRIVGSLAMFDRMIFKGHLTQLFHPGAVSAFLWAQGFPMTEFTRYAQSTTERITANAKALAAKTGRPYIYLDHAKTRSRPRTKEDMARAIAEEDGITEGVVCLISVVEPCRSFQVRASHTTHRLEATRRERKCVHHYLYLVDREFGVHARADPGVDPLRDPDLCQRAGVAGPPARRRRGRLPPLRQLAPQDRQPRAGLRAV